MTKMLDHNKTNRMIKFRAWDKKLKEIYIVEFLDFDNERVWSDNNTWEVSFSQVVLMQYTGLKDKNGVEIYEGDVVRFIHLNEKQIGKIQYSNKWATFYVGIKNKYGVGIAINNIHSWYYNNDDSDNTDCEVIGNIYSNPELLKQ